MEYTARFHAGGTSFRSISRGSSRFTASKIRLPPEAAPGASDSPSAATTSVRGPISVSSARHIAPVSRSAPLSTTRPNCSHHSRNTPSNILDAFATPPQAATQSRSVARRAALISFT